MQIILFTIVFLIIVNATDDKCPLNTVVGDQDGNGRDIGGCKDKKIEFTNIANKDVVKYIQAQTENLKKICEKAKEFKEYTWQLPLSSSKKLKFEKENYKTWKLVEVNGEKVLEIAQERMGYVSFHMEQTETSNPFSDSFSTSVYLDKLFPSSPRVSGVDIFQFLMSMCYVCKMQLSMKDHSDLSTPYTKLYGVRYYDSLVKGTEKNLRSQSTEIKKDEFLKCANEQAEKNENWIERWMKQITYSCNDHKVEIIKKQQKEQDPRPLIDYQDCPIVEGWLNKLLNQYIIRLCTGINNSHVLYKTLSFDINVADINRIMSKTLPKHLPSSYKDKCTTKSNPRSFDDIIEKSNTKEFFEKSFIFCYEMLEAEAEGMKITVMDILKIFNRCVITTMDFLYKFTCTI